MVKTIFYIFVAVVLYTVGSHYYPTTGAMIWGVIHNCLNLIGVLFTILIHLAIGAGHWAIKAITFAQAHK